jgi:hypothetical protein
MAAAAYICAIGLPFPIVIQERGRNIFAFQDDDGSVKAAYEEYILDDPFDSTSLISARKLFTAWRELKKCLPPREARP